MKFLLCLFAIIIICSANINAQSKQSEELQRQSRGEFDIQKSTKSNFEFYQSNYGVFGFNQLSGTAGGFWPRGSDNQYLYASGFWLGAKKTDPLSGESNKMVLIGYNPNSGRSWMSPGRIEESDTLLNDATKYRVYFSTDMYVENGVPKIETDGPNWPLWVTDPLRKYHYGVPLYDYVFDESHRNLQNYPDGPLFISDEDLITVFKDTDLRLYEGGIAQRENMGYPLRMQFESHIYSWGQGDMHDVVIQYYVIENKSSETYKDCWFAGVYDPDITFSTDAPTGGSNNDRVRFFEEEDLNLVVAWTDTTAGESGHEFGYMGISVMQSPAVDANGFLRTDKLIFEPNEQLGLVTFKSWKIGDDLLSDNDRYDYISSKDIGVQLSAGEVRTILATGPFHLRPNDKARIAFALNFAMPAKGGEADGTFEDIAGFVDKVKGSDDEQLQASENNSLVGKIKQVYKEYYENIVSKVIQSESYDNFGKVYPNPASEYIVFDYTLSTDTQLKIVLADELGRDIVVLFNNHRNSGNYHHFFDLNKLNLPNGAYFIRTESNKGSNMNKFILAK